jgi:putative endonuclease
MVAQSVAGSGMAKGQTWFVYLARCSDGSLYCGVARDVAARIAQHDAGKGARYTRGRGPLVTLAVRRCPSHGDALRLELAVKRLPREGKEALVDPKRFRSLERAVRQRSVEASAVRSGSAQQRKPVE